MDSRDQILISNYYALVWWAESLNQGFFQSKQFEEINFSDKFVQSRLAYPGSAAASLILPSLYVSLVLPKEIIFNEYKKEFDEIDTFLNTLDIEYYSTYPKDEKLVGYVKHIRNAVSHGSAEFAGGFIKFNDKDTHQGYKFSALLSLRNLGELVQKLQHIILLHVESLKRSA